MLKHSEAFSSFSVIDIEAARNFYADVLGVDVSKTDEGLALKLPGAGSVFLYPKPNHEPATFTVLNFRVDDIDSAVDALTAAGVVFEQYGGDIKTDEKGIFRHGGSGPIIAWFKDPSGNILSVVQSR